MNLSCHAILKSGKRAGQMCGAKATHINKRRPLCDQTKHYFGDCELAPLTTDSLYPWHLELAKIKIDFLSGDSIEVLVNRYKKTTGEIEATLRSVMR